MHSSCCFGERIVGFPEHITSSLARAWLTKHGNQPGPYLSFPCLHSRKQVTWVLLVTLQLARRWPSAQSFSGAMRCWGHGCTMGTQIS